MAAQHGVTTPRYLVEWYRPELADEPLEETARRIGHVAAEIPDQVELLLTLLVPADEVAFCLFAADSAELVARVCRRAELPYDRITQATEASPPGPGTLPDGIGKHPIHR